MSEFEFDMSSPIQIPTESLNASPIQPADPKPDAPMLRRRKATKHVYFSTPKRLFSTPEPDSDKENIFPSDLDDIDELENETDEDEFEFDSEEEEVKE